MTAVLLALLTGVLAGWHAGRRLSWPARFAHRLLLPVVYLLLFATGLRIGAHRELLGRLHETLFQASALALAAILGSCLAAMPASRWVRLATAAPAPAGDGAVGRPWVPALFILASFAAGAALAATQPVTESLDPRFIADGALYLLLFLVGIVVGADRAAWNMMRAPQAAVLGLALLGLAGTLLGALAVSPLLPELSSKSAAGVCAGMGYYSLSSALVTKLAGPSLGLLTLLTNVLRELLTLVLAPWLARLFGPLAPIASGGATSMDTTLPAIALASGKEYVFPAVLNGLILSLLVPVLLAGIFAWGR